MWERDPSVYSSLQVVTMMFGFDIKCGTTMGRVSLKRSQSTHSPSRLLAKETVLTSCNRFTMDYKLRSLKKKLNLFRWIQIWQCHSFSASFVDQ